MSLYLSWGAETSYKSFELKLEIHPLVAKSKGYITICEKIWFKHAEVSQAEI